MGRRNSAECRQPDAPVFKQYTLTGWLAGFRHTERGLTEQQRSPRLPNLVLPHLLLYAASTHCSSVPPSQNRDLQVSFRGSQGSHNKVRKSFQLSGRSCYMLSSNWVQIWFVSCYKCVHLAFKINTYDLWLITLNKCRLILHKKSVPTQF